MVGTVMRIFSFAFHILLGLVMMAVSFVAWASGQHTLQVPILPWTGETLTYCLFFSGLAGILVTALAVKRVIPVLFLVWSLVVLAMLVRGYFLSGFNFGYATYSMGSALKQLLLSTAFWMVVAALVAVIGSIMQVRRGGVPARRQAALA